MIKSVNEESTIEIFECINKGSIDVKSMNVIGSVNVKSIDVKSTNVKSVDVVGSVNVKLIKIRLIDLELMKMFKLNVENVEKNRRIFVECSMHKCLIGEILEFARIN